MVQYVKRTAIAATVMKGKKMSIGIARSAIDASWMMRMATINFMNKTSPMIIHTMKSPVQTYAAYL